MVSYSKSKDWKAKPNLESKMCFFSCILFVEVWMLVVVGDNPGLSAVLLVVAALNKHYRSDKKWPAIST